MVDDALNEVTNEVAELAPFDATKKKKKKNSTLQDLSDDFVDKLAEKTESLSVSDGLEGNFVGLKKKKKKPVEIGLLNEEIGDAGDNLDDHVDEDEQGEGTSLQQQRYPWEGSDRDYEYEELLGRVFNILRENNPELVGDRRRTVMRPPQVLREGTKKDCICEFHGFMQDICSYNILFILFLLKYSRNEFINIRRKNSYILK